MAESYSKVYVHLIWSTRYRAATIRPEWRRPISRYIVATLQRHRCEILAVSVVANHVHVLVWIPLDRSISAVGKTAKGASSHFVNSHLDQTKSFHWQEGFSAHSVSVYQLEQVKQYIRNQPIRHRDLDDHSESELPDDPPTTSLAMASRSVPANQEDLPRASDFSMVGDKTEILR